MNGSCLDIGTIQAFLDCELDHAASAEVSSHIAVCDACAGMLAEAEEESAIVFPMLEREMNTLVPTQRLWNKINDSIEVDRKNRPFWEKAWAMVSVTFATPALTAAAGLMIAVGVFALMWSNRNAAPADVAVSTPIAKPASEPTKVIAPEPLEPSAAKSDEPLLRTVRSEVASYTAPKIRLNETAAPAQPTGASPAAVNVAYMPGEESYIKTISNLSKIVDTQKDAAMRPSQRVAYERDMAVVDDAIRKMKGEVKKNPKNESAKQVLYASYQNKIDLLNSVSQKEELMASIR